MSRVGRGGALVSLAVGVVGVAGSFALAGPTTRFVAVPLHSLVVDTTPAPVVTASIRYLGKAGELLAFGAALVLAVALLAGAALVGRIAGRHAGATPGAVMGTYFAGWAVTAVLTRSPFPALAAAVPMAVFVGVGDRVGVDGAGASGRRRVLTALAGLAGVVGLSTALGLRRAAPEASPLSAIPRSERERIDLRLRTARAKSLDVAGLESPVTPIDAFYEVGIDAINPDVAAADWQLSITGAVGTERTVDYGDLTSMRPDHRFVTFRCVGEPLNGQLMDNALWTGVPVDRLLASVDVASDCECVMLRAADDYYEEFLLEALRGGFLAYGMNGTLLPRKHGFPARALIPGHWGEINVKWLTEIELLEREAEGFWEARGWHGTGPVTTVAKLHARNRLPDGRLQVAGHAYAGTRGVASVEVSVDGGERWSEARLSPPLRGEDVWRQWAHEYRATGEHEVVVRAVDGTGRVQPETRTDPYPSGPSGWSGRSPDPTRATDTTRGRRAWHRTAARPAAGRSPAGRRP